MARSGRRVGFRTLDAGRYLYHSGRLWDPRGGRREAVRGRPRPKRQIPAQREWDLAGLSAFAIAFPPSGPKLLCN